MSFARSKLSATARGYGTEHQRQRRAWLAALEHAGSLPCTRCPRPVLPGQALHLDHTDDRTGYLGLCHAQCNVRDGARRGRARQNVTAWRM